MLNRTILKNQGDLSLRFNQVSFNIPLFAAYSVLSRITVSYLSVCAIKNYLNELLSQR